MAIRYRREGFSTYSYERKKRTKPALYPNDEDPAVTALSFHWKSLYGDLVWVKTQEDTIW
jgi:hypothetical protein